MTGPTYPPGPSPGSNSIGQFQIGVSPIGTIPSFDVWSSVISQYANSPILTSLITSFNAAMDLTEPLDSFYDLVFNVLTAQGYGLDCWGRIVVVSRTLQIPGSASFFGFNESGNDWTGFGQGGFYSGQPIGSSVTLTDAQFRPLVLAKAAANISNGSIQAYNSILMGLFAGRGQAYVADNRNMSMTLTFNFPLQPIDLAIIQSSGVLPNPPGVVVTIAAP